MRRSLADRELDYRKTKQKKPALMTSAGFEITQKITRFDLAPL